MVAWKGSIVTATIANVNMVMDKTAMGKDAKDTSIFYFVLFRGGGWKQTQFLGQTASPSSDENRQFPNFNP